MSHEANVHVPHFPDYEATRIFIRLVNGQSRRTLTNLREIILGQRGTPQETKDWSDPETWIPEYLTGDVSQLAIHIWRRSEGLINPRHLTGLWLLTSSYGLLVADQQDVLNITKSGQDFLDHPFGETEEFLDLSEGLLYLLTIVAEYGPGKRSDFLGHFSDFLSKNSNIRANSVVSSYWYSRTRNLVKRGLIKQAGVTYEVTEDGLRYLRDKKAVLKKSGSSSDISEPLTAMQDLRKALDKELRKNIENALSKIDPYVFEELIGRLLEAMGYRDVVVTPKSRDGGVDVIGNIEVGITTVKEVVQVKRYNTGSVGSREVNQLRGVLPKFGALRGTIITRGRFAKGAREDALVGAPITLIDGNKLVDLLIKHRIGVREQALAPLLVFDSTEFESTEEETDV